MSDCIHHDYTIVEDYIRGLQWSPAATDHEKSLVAGNIRGFYAHLLATHPTPTAPASGVSDEWVDARRYRALRNQAWGKLEIESSEFDEEADAIIKAEAAAHSRTQGGAR